MEISKVAVDKLEIGPVEKLFRILFGIRKIDRPISAVEKSNLRVVQVVEHSAAVIQRASVGDAVDPRGMALMPNADAL